MKLHKGDTVQVIAGKDKGKQGSIERVYAKNNTILIKGINIVKKHVKKTDTTPGGIYEMEKPLDISKVMFFDATTKKPSRLGYRVEDGVKKRISKSSGQVV